MTEAPEWKDMADWSGLPDVYVTRAECSQEMFWRIEACSVPMAIGPEVRLICAAKHDRIVAEKDAEIARLRAALLSGKAFAEDWIAEHGGIDGCDYSDRSALENMCTALGDTDE